MAKSLLRNIVIATSFAVASMSSIPNKSDALGILEGNSINSNSIIAQAPNTIRIAVVNNSGKVLNAVYMAAPSTKDWGANELLAPVPDRVKADFVWNRSDFKGAEAGCVFDLRAEYSDGKFTEIFGLDLCKTPAINLKPPSSDVATKPVPNPEAKAPDIIRVAVVNNSGKVLNAVYMAAPSTKDWGANELNAPVPDREKNDFEWKRSDYKGADAGCIFDVRAEYSDGKFTELFGLDLCTTPAINLKK